MTELDDAPGGAEQALLRETFRRHEHLADGAAERLLPGLRERSGRRHRPQWAVAGVLVLLIAAAVPAAVALLERDPDAPVGTASPTSPPGPPTGGEAPAGWRWESSLGLQALVPDSWSVNDFGCNQTAAPTVVRALGAQDACLTPEPAGKELAIFDRPALPVTAEGLAELAGLDTGAPRTASTIDDHPAVRVQGQRPDGRYAGVVVVADRGAALVVRARSAQTVTAILDSLRVVEIDHRGCPALRPEVSGSWTAQAPVPADVPPDVITLCYYTGFGSSSQPTWRNLDTSAQLTAEAAAQLAAMLATASPGANTDPPAGVCAQREVMPPDVLLLLRYGDGAVRPIWVTFRGCVHRGLTDGVGEWQLTQRMIAAIMAPSGSGYLFLGGLPD